MKSHVRAGAIFIVIALAAIGSLQAFLAVSSVKAKVPPARAAAKTPAKSSNASAKAVAKSSNATERQAAMQWMRGMTLQQKIAQLIVITTYGENPPSRSKPYRDFVHHVRDLRVGGVIVVNHVINGTVKAAEPYAMAAFLNRMQKMARVPLLVGGDFERGASMRVDGTVKYPHLMAYGAANDPALTRALGAATAREARALGVNWVFAPDADVNNNPDNPIINVRSFGEDPQLVATQVKAFIEGARSNAANRVLVTVKHFPGHGDTATDSHIGMATLTADRARMDAVELVPFRAAIAENVDAVMTAHMSVPSVDDRPIPATVSQPVLTGLLRNQLDFKGLVVTDAMDMQGLTKLFGPGEASVRALEAGADVLLMPTDPDEVVQNVTKAVKAGRITKAQIDASVMRVLMAKAKVGLQKKRMVDLDAITDELDSPEGVATAQTAAERALTLVRNERGALPLGSVEQSCLMVLTESRYGPQGRAMMAEVKRLAPNWKAVQLDPTVPPVEVQDVISRFSSCSKPVIAAFASSGAYRGNIALAPAYQPLLQAFLDKQVPLTLVALGSPYLLRTYPKVDAYLATFSVVPPSEIAVVRALLGQTAIGGHMPVSIPELAKVGDGLTLPASVASPASAGN